MKKSLAVAIVVIKELYRRKDFYVLFILTALITLLLGSINLFNEDRIVGHLKEVCLFLIWISMLAMAVATAARQIPTEVENKTIFPLLAKPVTRGGLLLGKFLGCWLICGLALLVFYSFFGVMSASREHVLPLGIYLQGFWMHWVFLAIVISMTLLGSLVFAAPSSNATIVLIVVVGILSTGQYLLQLSTQMASVPGTLLSLIYYMMPHLEFYDFRMQITHNWAARPWGGVLLASLYGASYTALFLFSGWLVFRRKVLTL